MCVCVSADSPPGSQREKEKLDDRWTKEVERGEERVERVVEEARRRGWLKSIRAEKRADALRPPIRSVRQERMCRAFPRRRRLHGVGVGVAPVALRVGTT